MLGVANTARERAEHAHLREVTTYAAESAEEVLEIFETAPGDMRPRDAVDAAWTFA